MEFINHPESSLWRVMFTVPAGVEFQDKKPASWVRNESADVVAPTLEKAAAAVRLMYPQVTLISVNKISKTGLFFMVAD